MLRSPGATRRISNTFNDPVMMTTSMPFGLTAAAFIVSAARRPDSDLAGGARVLFLAHPRLLGTTPWPGYTDWSSCRNLQNSAEQEQPLCDCPS
ncbi:hypothetical protein T08_1286 [Trichinella sp. T8]|nr:hypothetical protein T08_1286 [Trichinella sp. T8]